MSNQGSGRQQAVEIAVGSVRLGGVLGLPAGARGVVLFANATAASRHSAREIFVASALQEAGLATLLLDLLAEEEAADRARPFDIELLADRLAGATRWARARAEVAGLPVGYLGADTGSAAALLAAARDREVGAVVSRGGRPD
ncbi:MAG TPA: hypothetical protein VNM66_04120, partial [Thermodesulfobacteriota bacterium]|nr:hypothetical protein [Thermodesulfobacteriota bacterium]